MTREDVMSALYAKLTAGGAYKTIGRRLVLWTKVAEQPALFLRHVGDEVVPRPTGMPPKIVIECEVWLYANTGANPDISPEIAINGLLDTVEVSLQPAPGVNAQTLGGLVAHTWIEGKIDIHPGDLGGQAIAIIPVKMLVPSLHGPTG